MVQDRTTLIIAHRLSNIKDSDKMVVLKHGEVLEVGNHDELIGIDGYYKDMIQGNINIVK